MFSSAGTCILRRRWVRDWKMDGAQISRTNTDWRKITPVHQYYYFNFHYWLLLLDFISCKNHDILNINYTDYYTVGFLIYLKCLLIHSCKTKGILLFHGLLCQFLKFPFNSLGATSPSFQRFTIMISLWIPQTLLFLLFFIGIYVLLISSYLPNHLQILFPLCWFFPIITCATIFLAPKLISLFLLSMLIQFTLDSFIFHLNIFSSFFLLFYVKNITVYNLYMWLWMVKSIVFMSSFLAL